MPTSSLLEKYKRIITHVDLKEVPSGALDYITLCLDPKSFDPSIDLVRFTVMTYKLAMAVEFRFYEKLLDLNQQGLELIKGKGYRGNIYTFQEHRLIGSTLSVTYDSTLYRSIGVIEGELSIPEANRARELAQSFRIDGAYFNENLPVLVTLEPLDEDGNTTRDPCRLDDLGNRVETVYAANFPFRRL